MLRAGLDGISRDLEPPAPIEENIYRMSGSRQKKLGIRLLPRSLDEATRTMEKSDLIKDTLGSDHIFEKFIANKKQEFADYRKNVSPEYDKQVSSYETEKFLPIL